MDIITLLKSSVLIIFPIALHIGLMGGRRIKNGLGEPNSRLAAIPVWAIYVFDIFFGLMLYGTYLSWLKSTAYFYPLAIISFVCAVLFLTVVILNPYRPNDN